MSLFLYFGPQLRSLTRYSIIHKRCFSVVPETEAANSNSLKLVKDADASSYHDASIQRKKIGATIDDQKSLLKRKPKLEEHMRTLKVALIGTPNAGKSTLANRLVGWKFAPVSQKVHTTRHKILGVLSEGNNQVVLMDTPGVIVPSVMKKHKLCQTMLVDPHMALCESQMIVVVVDVSCLWNRTHLDSEVLSMLHVHSNKPAVLVLNKVDLLKSKQELLNTVRILTEGCLDGQKYQRTKKALLENEKQIDLNAMFEKCKDIKTSPLTDGNEIQSKGQDHPAESSHIDDIHASENQPAANITSEKSLQPSRSINLKDEVQWQQYQKSIEKANRVVKTNGWPNFKEVFMMSAINGDGVFELKNFLLKSTKPSKWLYNPDVITTQNPKLLAQQIVWEKLLDNLPKEIPYQIEVKLMLWEIGDDDLLRAQFDLKCSRRRQIHHILGKDGEMIKKISSEVKQELMNAFRRELTLQLVVKGTENTLPRLKKTEHKKKFTENNQLK